MENKTTITRQELYDIVWKESLTAISKRLSISYQQLRKACFEMNVPVPLNGHWSKLLFGKPVVVLELPENYQGADVVVLEPVVGSKGNITADSGASLSILDEITNDKSLPLKVPRRLSDPNKLIVSAQKSLTEHPHAWRNSRGMVRTSWGELDVRVSPASVNRALCFLDALIKILQARGHNVISGYKFAKAVLDGHEFDFNLKEKNQQVSFRGWNDSEYKPTGILTFMIGRYSGKTWSDTKAPIETKLGEIVTKLEIDAQKIRAERLIYEEQERNRREEARVIREQREEKERIIREQQQRIEKEKSDFNDLFQQAERWQRARFMREYLIAYEQDAVEKGYLTDEEKKWLKWASDKLEWFDPLINRDDMLLGKYIEG